MDACREIRPWLEWLAAGEMDAERGEAVSAHLSSCPSCRRELESWRALLAAASAPDAGLDAEMRAIDWEALTRRIAAGAVAGSERRHAARRRVLSLVPLAAAAAVLAAVGVALFLRPQPRGGALPGSAGEPAAVAARLQAGLAREEVVGYLQQSQMMLTDLLNDCSSNEMASWEVQLYSRTAKELLLKKKYVQQSLPAAEWLKVSPVSERIDWLNYEILQLEDRQNCGQVQRLQRVLEAEKLLLKIRLLEKDLSSKPYIEA